MLFASWEVRIGDKCVRGPALGGAQDRGQIFFNTDRPTLVNNIFIFSSNLTKFFPKEPE